MITTTVNYSSCPKCKNCYDMYWFGLSTGLGPELAKCNRCKTVFQSGKKEWLQMSSIKKTLFWILSGLYAIFSGGCGILFSCLIKSVFYGRVSNWPPLNSPISVLLLVICFLSFGSFVIYVQIKRIINSNSRSLRKRANLIPVTTSFKNFEFGLQLTFMYLWAIIYCPVGLLTSYYK